MIKLPQAVWSSWSTSSGMYDKQGYNTLDHFLFIQMDSQTTDIDINHFADIFHNDVTIKALETLQSKIQLMM